MKNIKMISIEPELIDAVLEETNNFSKAVEEALNDWVASRRETGLGEAEKKSRIEKLKNRLIALEESTEERRALKEITDWFMLQTPEMRGTIEEFAKREKKNWTEVAREYQSGKRQVLLF